MRDNDRFQAQRAEEARQWLRAPERRGEEARDRAHRAELDRKAGHLTTCTLTRCATTCPRLGGAE